MNQNFESESMLQHILDASPDLLLIINIQTAETIYSNNRINTLFCFPESPSHSCNFSRLFSAVHPEEKEFFSNFFKAQNISDDDQFELICRIMKPGNEYGWFKLRNKIFSRDETGRIKEVMSTITDITEERVIYNRMRDEETRFRAIYNNTTDLNFLVDKNMHLLAFNKTAEKHIRQISGMQLKLGQALLDVVPRSLQDAIRYKINEALDGFPSQLLQSYQNQDGYETWYRSRYYPVYRINETEIIGVNISTRDVSELVNANITLEKQNKRLKEIARMNAHEIRKPLTNIMGLVHLVEIDNQRSFSGDTLMWLSHLKSASLELDNIIKAIVRTASASSDHSL